MGIGSCIEWAFSNKVAEDWQVRLRCRQGGRHIDEANHSNVADELQNVFRFHVTASSQFRISLRKIGK